MVGEGCDHNQHPVHHLHPPPLKGSIPAPGTKKALLKIRPDSRAVYFDIKARGLALRISPTGAKTSAFVYRANGRSQWLTLGSYPALRLADARTLALDHRHRIDVVKRDPAAEQRANREAAQSPPLGHGGSRARTRL